MHHGDGLTSVLGGVFLSITANAAGWVDAAGIAGHSVQTLFFGFIGGVGGWVGKRCIDELIAWRKSKNKNNN